MNKDRFTEDQLLGGLTSHTAHADEISDHEYEKLISASNSAPDLVVL